jgi:hypothetical protein
MQNHSRIYKILPKIIGVKVYFSKSIVLALTQILVPVGLNSTTEQRGKISFCLQENSHSFYSLAYKITFECTIYNDVMLNIDTTIYI